MDVIALEKAGIQSSIALMGTALSKQHILMLKKLNVEVRLCLDGDIPGQEATMRALPLLLKNNIPVRIVNNIKDSKDPDEILNKSGKDELIKYINNLLTPFDFVINFYKNTKTLDNLEDKKALITRFLPLLLATKSQLEFDDYIYKLSEVTGFSSNAIKNLVKNARVKNNNKIDSEDVEINPSKVITMFHPERKELRRLEKAEREILFHMLSHDEAIKFYEKDIEYFYTSIYREIANYIIESKGNSEEPVSVNNLITNIEMSTSSKKEELKGLLDQLLTERTHLRYSIDLLNNCKDIIEKEKKRKYRKDKIIKATEGKTEEEKARVIADTLRQDD